MFGRTVSEGGAARFTSEWVRKPGMLAGCGVLRGDNLLPPPDPRPNSLHQVPKTSPWAGDTSVPSCRSTYARPSPLLPTRSLCKGEACKPCSATPTLLAWLCCPEKSYRTIQHFTPSTLESWHSLYCFRNMVTQIKGDSYDKPTAQCWVICIVNAQLV